MSRFFVLVEYICQHNNSLLRSIMTSFNEWLEQRDERIYNELFEKQGMELGGGGEDIITAHTIPARRSPYGIDDTTLSLTEKGKNLAKTMPFVKFIDQLGRSVGRFVRSSNLGASEQINLGQLENELNNALGSDWSRGKNAFMAAVNSIARQNDAIAKGNTGGLGMRIISKDTAAHLAKQGRFKHEPIEFNQEEDANKRQRIIGAHAINKSFKQSDDDARAQSQADLAAAMSSKPLRRR
jgi:hypothetical protein